MKADRFNQFKLILALWALAAHASAASTIFVCNANDAGAGSLRAAITTANNAGGGDIKFSVTGTITLLSTLPSLAANMTVTGPGIDRLTISGNTRVPVFSMNPGTTNILSNLTIADGFAGDGSYLSGMSGGGISNAGSLKLLDCAILGCEADYSGGGVYSEGALLMQGCEVAGCAVLRFFRPDGGGGGIANFGNMRLENCRVSRCGASIFPGGADGGGIYNQATLVLTSCVIESCYGDGDYDGAGICSLGGSLSIYSCTVSNCNGGWGGGMFCDGGLAMTNSNILDNRGGYGGGLTLWGGTNVLVGCTVSGNGSSEGIFNGGVLSLVNCTISDNSYEGIVNADVNDLATNATLFMDHCTVAFNTDGGVGNQGAFYSQNSLFAGNGAFADCEGVLTSQGYNLIQNTNQCTIMGNETGDIYGVDPLLGPLQDNGGPTWTHALPLGSRALDAGPAGTPPSVDQRGEPRPSGPAEDIGSFEYQYGRPVILAIQPANAIGNVGSNVAFTVTANGTPSLGYQWQLNGVDLVDDDHHSGARSTTLTISDIQPRNSGRYAVTVSNSLGTTNSPSARLAVAPMVVFIGHTNNGGNARNVATVGQYAYLANEDDGLRIYDISNPANPANIGHADNGGSAWAVAVADHYAYLANLDDGLRVYDISNPANPVNVGHIDNGGQARGVAVAGNYAYLANYDDGLRIYCVTDPANPAKIAHVNDGGLGLGVLVAGNYAYLADDSGGLRIYSITNPASPVSIGHPSDACMAKGLTVAGLYAYLADGNDGLRIYDIASPVNPINVAHINDGGQALGVAVNGNYAYLANFDDGLRIYDISTPADPVSVGHINVGGSVCGLTLAGHCLYVAAGTNGLCIYAVPITPPLISGLGVRPGNNYCFQATGTPGETYALHVSTNLIDWSNLTNVMVGFDNLFEFADPLATNCPARFYRLKFTSP